MGQVEIINDLRQYMVRIEFGCSGCQKVNSFLLRADCLNGNGATLYCLTCGAKYRATNHRLVRELNLPAVINLPEY